MDFWCDVSDGLNIYLVLAGQLSSLVPLYVWLPHHVTGTFSGTFSITFSASSLSKFLFTLSSQCSGTGTGTGLCAATGLAPT